MYKELKIKEFIEKLSSSDSMPGGGVASSLIAANGVSLLLMVCNLTIGKEKYKENEEIVKNVKKEAEILKEKFLDLMDEDAKNFKAIEEVYKLNNNTEEEKKIRSEKMQKACIKCCEAPKEIIDNAKKGIELIKQIEGKSNKSAASDLVIGKMFLETAILGAWENIAINLKYIKDEETIKHYTEYKNNVLK